MRSHIYRDSDDLVYGMLMAVKAAALAVPQRVALNEAPFEFKVKALFPDLSTRHNVTCEDIFFLLHNIRDQPKKLHDTFMFAYNLMDKDPNFPTKTLENHIFIGNEVYVLRNKNEECVFGKDQLATKLRYFAALKHDEEPGYDNIFTMDPVEVEGDGLPTIQIVAFIFVVISFLVSTSTGNLCCIISSHPEEDEFEPTVLDSTIGAVEEVGAAATGTASFFPEITLDVVVRQHSNHNARRSQRRVVPPHLQAALQKQMEYAQKQEEVFELFTQRKNQTSRLWQALLDHGAVEQPFERFPLAEKWLLDFATNPLHRTEHLKDMRNKRVKSKAKLVRIRERNKQNNLLPEFYETYERRVEECLKVETKLCIIMSELADEESLISAIGRNEDRITEIQKDIEGREQELSVFIYVLPLLKEWYDEKNTVLVSFTADKVVEALDPWLKEAGVSEYRRTQIRQTLMRETEQTTLGKLYEVLELINDKIEVAPGIIQNKQNSIASHRKNVEELDDLLRRAQTIA